MREEVGTARKATVFPSGRGVHSDNDAGGTGEIRKAAGKWGRR